MWRFTVASEGSSADAFSYSRKASSKRPWLSSSFARKTAMAKPEGLGAADFGCTGDGTSGLVPAAQARISQPDKPSVGASPFSPLTTSDGEVLKRYQTDVKNYAKCLDFEASQNRISREEHQNRNNAAVERLQQLAAQFNKQLRIFEARGS